MPNFQNKAKTKPELESNARVLEERGEMDYTIACAATIGVSLCASVMMFAHPVARRSRVGQRHLGGRCSMKLKSYGAINTLLTALPLDFPAIISNSGSVGNHFYTKIFKFFNFFFALFLR